MNGISGISAASATAIKGFGGLASGLDRDELIKGMTFGTQTKIDATKQKKTLETYRQEAVQDVTKRMNEFSEKYMSFISGDNLLGSGNYTKNTVEALGDFKDCVNVTGNSSSAEDISILGVKQLAEDASLVSNSARSTQKISTKGINLDATESVKAFTSASFEIKINDNSYEIEIEEGKDYDFSKAEDVLKAINEACDEINVQGGDKLSKHIEFAFDKDSQKVSITDTNNNSISIEDGTEKVLEKLGFGDAMTGDKLEISTDGKNKVESSGSLSLVEDKSIRDALSGQRIDFSYNGKNVKITLDEYEKGTKLADVQKDIQNKLDNEIGRGRVKVDLLNRANGSQSLSFETMNPATNTGDKSSTLKITSASAGLLGETGVLGIEQGSSNRVNMNASIDKSGLKTGNLLGKFDNLTIGNGSGELINLADHGITKESTVKEIVDKLNEIDELKISVTYEEGMDKFVVKSTESGASGEVELKGSIAQLLFNDSTKTEGQDAIMRIKDEKTGAQMDIVRGENDFTYNEMTFSVKKEFGYLEDGSIDPNGKEITFKATPDTSKIEESIDTMIKDFNELVKHINTETNTRYDKSYKPLTSAQKDAMTESEIENWEKKAKTGLLYNDSDMRNLSSELRFMMPTALYEKFEEIGITVSDNYRDNGKLILDKDKLKTALANDPEGVYELFSSEDLKNESGLSVGKGLVEKMQDTFEKYAGMSGSTKGILVERAGSEFAPTSILTNTMKKSIDEYDKVIDRYEALLKAETDRYVSQFTQLETMISQMNSQSATLSSYFAV